MPRRVSCWMIVVVLFLPAAAAAQAQSRKLSLDLYLDMEEVADPQISPDGKQTKTVRASCAGALSSQLPFQGEPRIGTLFDPRPPGTGTIRKTPFIRR